MPQNGSCSHYERNNYKRAFRKLTFTTVAFGHVVGPKVPPSMFWSTATYTLSESERACAVPGQNRTFEKLRVYRYCFISTMTGLSMSLIRITTVLEGLSVRLLPKCGVFGGV